MIFVTVGTQIPFDRMVSVVDEWATNTDEEVVAQVGPTERRFAHLNCFDFLDPTDFDRLFLGARLIIAHAGIGSILSALSFGKPIIVMPRRALLGEHRNDHQLSTAKRFNSVRGLTVAWNELDLSELLMRYQSGCPESEVLQICDHAPEPFLKQLREFIDAEVIR